MIVWSKGYYLAKRWANNDRYEWYDLNYLGVKLWDCLWDWKTEMFDGKTKGMRKERWRDGEKEGETKKGGKD